MDPYSIIENNSYKVFKHSEDCPYGFICDKRISEVISILNKKGYHTVASCGGHYKVEFYEWFDEDLALLDEYKKNDKVIIKNIKDNTFDYWIEVDSTYIYILFDREYKFELIPDRFEITYLDDLRTCIECKINYYNKDNERRKRVVVEEELDMLCDTLKKWADSLPNKKGDNNE